ncbi:hypothetical protein IKP13_03880 [bacterium]|nr:hypothetical protein [bacterium]
MKKSSFFIFIVFLFSISCSNGEEPLVPCVTVSDCPDSSYSCFDGFCVHAGSVVDPTDTDSGDPSGNTLPEGEVNDGGDTSDNGENGRNDETDSGLPDPVTEDDDDVRHDTDTVEENDDDVPAADDEKSDEDGVEGEDADSGNNGDNDNDTDNDIDNDADADVDNDADADNDTDAEVELPTELSACAAAIAALPHGGKYDWDDGTTQGFSTNTYWNLVESSVLPARSGSYSFGKYSANKGYSQNMDYTSALGPADLSACKTCMVKATFYAKGKNYFSSCTNSNKSYIHPTCNGEGTTTATNATGVPWSQAPASPWVATKEDSGVEFLAYATGCRYSDQAWVDEYHNKPLMWTIPDTCLTDEFVFGLRFRSDSSVEGHGLVVDDLTIYTTTKNEPKGEFESAENGKISGWACDPDEYFEKVPVKVRYYKNKDESVVAAERSVDAESERTDLTQCDGTYNHGFEIPLDGELAAVLGIGTHSAAVFAGDLPAECAGTYKLIGKKEFEITSLDPKK